MALDASFFLRRNTDFNTWIPQFVDDPGVDALFYLANASKEFTAMALPIAATFGGTGFASYAVGDLLYADTPSTLAKLADIATGNVLLSGGVGVAPSFGKVGLTTHVTGTLPVTNGGTGLAAAALGDLLYGSASNVLSRLTGNITTTRKFLREVGDGVGSAAPAWDTLVAGDIPDLSSVYQPLNSNLTAISLLTTAAFGRGGLEMANAGAFRTYIGAGTSSFSGAFSDLTGIPTSAVGYGIVGGATLDAIAALTTTSFGRGLLTEANAASLKTTLSLNNVENTALSTWAGSTNLTTLGTIATGTWSATAIAVTKGGTGLTTIASGKLLYASALDTLSALSLGNSLAITTGTLDTIQDIRTSAAPLFASLAVGLASGGELLEVAANGRSIFIHGRHSSNSAEASMFGQKSRGTKASPTTIVSGDSIYSFTAQAYDGTGYVGAGQFVFGTEGTIGTNRVGGNFSILLHPDSTSAIRSVLDINAAGDVGIGTATPGYKLEVAGTFGTFASAGFITSESTGADGNQAGLQALGPGNANWLIVTNKSSLTGAADTLGFYKNAGTTGLKLAITNAGLIQGKRFVPTAGTPTAVGKGAAGTGPTVSVTGTDSGFRLTVVVGTSPNADDDIAWIDFNTAFAAAPFVVVTGNTNLAADVYTSGTTTSRIFFSVRGTLAAGATYKWDFVVVGA